MFLFFIIACCLIILGVNHFLSPTFSKADDLDVLILNQDAAPTFRLTSQLTYTSELTQAWSQSFTERALDSSDSANNIYSDMNLLVDLENIALDTDSFFKDLDILSSTSNKLSLSILPASHMTDEIYLDQCRLLYDALHTNQLSHISLIIYPKDITKLSLYHQDFITCIGTVLQESGDLEKLNAIYNAFIEEKTLFVRDDIKNLYTENAFQASKEMNTLYYTLAIQYPGVDTIFSPFVAPNSIYDGFEDPYFLNSQDESYYLFYTVYNRLVDKNWLTTGKEKVASVSPYVPLESYALLSGEVEMVLDPKGDLLSHLSALKTSTGDTYSISFKWNASSLPTTAGYPYGVTLDTDAVPNGISRLKAILLDGEGSVLEVHSLDLRVKHPVAVTRAARIQSSTVVAPADTEVERSYVPILMYHTVDDTILPESQNSCVETKNFEAQMKALVENGYTPINFSDLKSYMEGTVLLPEHPVIITMDDGYLNNYTKAYPIYKKYGIQATLFVSPYYVSENNTERHLGWAAAREMEESGLIDIQPHGYDHTPFPYLSVEDLKHHITLSKSMIEHELGPRDVWVVACPEFRNNTQTRKVLASLGVDFQITSLAKKGTVLSPTSLKRINVPNTMTPDELIATLDALTH